VNKDRRQIAKVSIELMKECNEIGLISDASHDALVEATMHLQAAEHWQLKNQLKHEGKNPGTDTQIAISRVALPALEEAVQELKDGNYSEVITKLELALNTDGTLPKPTKKARR
jgi:hypothetical protein